jgi:hypothetical protein
VSDNGANNTISVVRMFALLFSNRVIHVPQKDRALYTALINTFCAVLMGIAALELAIKPEALMAALAARGVTPDNSALNAMAIGWTR